MRTDPIADFCTRIRNATLRQHENVVIPFSNIKKNLAQVLYEEGFIHSFEIKAGKKFSEISIQLKYDSSGDSVIRKIQRISKPGLRIYKKIDELKPILNGQGISIVTTSQGVISDHKCRRLQTGGEVLCQVW